MSSSEPIDERGDTVAPALPRSPILLAAAISLAVAVGTVVTTLDLAPVVEFASGQWLTQPLAETQQHQAEAITSLETKLSAITRDIDFVVSRIGGSALRSEEQISERFARLDSEIAAFKTRLASVQAVRVSPPLTSDVLFGDIGVPRAPVADTNDELPALRASLHDLSGAHNGAVAAITKRLDRIEVMVGLSTDMASSAGDPARRQQARRRTLGIKAAKKREAPAPQLESAADRGNPFGIKPMTRDDAPLRVSRLPG